jgi:hypothetical protein
MTHGGLQGNLEVSLLGDFEGKLSLLIGFSL